ncbi:hypothetical protein F2Q68_00005065 [Brassica cretica]|uniref:Aspartic peptidase DDI1-type domain-containing protein n=1 Tax=Brassica cretica TaxID=69181 RepID=A0A8S9J9Q7_BRACR|nr:hypothetical protein F2Q68_00005065 [Brassica cretica]
MRNFSTCKDVMEQINSKQKLLGKEHISAILPTEPTARRSMKSFHHRSTSVQNHNPLDPYGYAREIVGHVRQVSKEDTADILQMANGVDNLFMQQCTVPTTQKDVQNSAEVLLTFLEPENSTRKRKMNMESTEMIKDVQEMWIDTSSMCPKRNMLAHSHRPSWYQRSTPRTRSMRCSMESVEPKRSKKGSYGKNPEEKKRKEKVAKHLKREASEKERESFQKRVFRIPLEKPFEEAYFTHIYWMFFREKRETEEDIGRMFCEARKNMRKRITLKKKSDPGQFAKPCTVKGIEFPHALCDIGASVNILPRVMADQLGLQVELGSKELFTFVDCSQRNSGEIVRDLEVQIGNALVPVDFHVLDIKLNWNSSLLLGRAFLSTVGAVCNLLTNQLCLTLIDPHVHYNPIPVKKPQTSSRKINDPGIIAPCHSGAEYEI